MEVENQKNGDHGGGGSYCTQSSGSKWAFRSFLPGPSGRTATPMSEGGGRAYKQTNGPYVGRLIGGGTRSQIYGDMRYGSGYPSGVLSVSGAPFPFGFYPLYMLGPNMKSTEEYAPSTLGYWRPGGDIGAQFITSKPLGPAAGRFYLIGESSSVSVAQVALTANCNATSLDEPFTTLMYPIPDGTNTTHYPETTEIIQFYRASSFALSLSGFDANALPEGTVSADAAFPSSVDRTFLQCINSTIASTIPILNASDKHTLPRAVFQTIICSGVIGILLVGVVSTYWRSIRDSCFRPMRRLGRQMKANIAGRDPSYRYQRGIPTPPVDVETSRSRWWLSNIRLYTVLLVAALLARDNSVDAVDVGSIVADTSGIFLEGTIGEWDMDTKTLSFRFVAMLCDTNGENCSKSLKDDLFFFQNSDALGEGGFNKSNAILEFKSKWQNIAFDQGMDLKASQYAVAGKNGGLETNVRYPWDWYAVSILVAATRGDLNTTVPILGVRLRNAMQTEWRFKVGYRHVNIDSQAAKLSILFVLDRTYTTTVSATLILILNWIVTLGILWMTLAYRMTSYRSMEGLESIALPFASLFALPTMRSVMPGQPPLGCFIDFAGIIPNLAIFSVCISAPCFSYCGIVAKPALAYSL